MIRSRIFASVLTVFAVCSAFDGRVAAQAPPRLPQPPVERSQAVQPPFDLQNAEETRKDFREVMRRYPPALGRVLKLDATLMTNPTYMASYPALAEFLKMHPEIPRYSGYFLSYVDEYGNSYEPRDAATQLRAETINMWRNTVDGLFFFCVFLVVTYTLTWLVRYVVGHRRWIRATKVQTEVHSRLLERFSSNDELLAYVQSPAGSHFLKAAPVAVDMNGVNGSANISAPFSRILWSIQAGLVLACAGIGFLFIKGQMVEEVAQMMMAIGTLAISIGIGFALAATVSYVLSQRLGLFEKRTPATKTD
ncbi:MAG TPA: hypothetical protein VFV98_18155 [Vicinamibacterales bacterium]|nr:hypothetical protein [Vicinamibacterales bacterium]